MWRLISRRSCMSKNASSTCMYANRPHHSFFSMRPSSLRSTSAMTAAAASGYSGVGVSLDRAESIACASSSSRKPGVCAGPPLSVTHCKNMRESKSTQCECRQQYARLDGMYRPSGLPSVCSAPLGQMTPAQPSPLGLDNSRPCSDSHAITSSAPSSDKRIGRRVSESASTGVTPRASHICDRVNSRSGWNSTKRDTKLLRSGFKLTEPGSLKLRTGLQAPGSV